MIEPNCSCNQKHLNPFNGTNLETVFRYEYSEAGCSDKASQVIITYCTYLYVQADCNNNVQVMETYKHLREYPSSHKTHKTQKFNQNPLSK